MTSVLLTAGPTRAYLDDVRYLSNYSTGGLGYEICRSLIRKKIRVFAIVGPTHFPFNKLKGVTLTQVETVEEMHREVLAVARKNKPHYAVLSAAVLDFQPKRKVHGKVSSKRKNWIIRLVPTPKIIDDLHSHFPKVKKIGFKLEIHKRSKASQQKIAHKIMQEKGLEFLVFNYLKDMKLNEHLAYSYQRAKTGLVRQYRSKRAIARSICDFICEDL